MSIEIICNTTGRETRVAVLEHGRLVELNIDRGEGRGYVGNIYLGKVVRVLPGMQAAFVDVGLDRAAFLYVGDIYTGSTDEVGVNEDEPTVARSRKRSSQPPIQNILKEGQQLIVQVSKDPIGTKGARLTTHIAIAGRYIVYMPTVEHIGISKRIDKSRERKRLRAFVDKYRPKGAGFIVRTVCRGQSTENLKADMDYLLGAWSKIEEASKDAKAPKALHSEHGLVLRGVRDQFNASVTKLVLDDKKIYEEVREFMSRVMPQHLKRVHLYRGKRPVFENYKVDMEMKRSLGRKVWLKSGGYLVIDQTEALMAIDVNSGKFVGKTSSLEDTMLQINMEASDEVVHQLRLRNMGGIIIIDFIDMDSLENREKVYKSLKEALRKDRSRTNVLKISDLGLVQMTRKRVQEGLDRFLNEDCPTCEGIGVVKSRATTVFEILRSVLKVSKKKEAGSSVFVNTTPDIADTLYGDYLVDLEMIEEEIGDRVVVTPFEHYHPSQYEVYSK